MVYKLIIIKIWLKHAGEKFESDKWSDFYEKLKVFFNSKDLFAESRIIKAEYFIKGPKAGIQRPVTQRLGDIIETMCTFTKDAK